MSETPNSGRIRLAVFDCDGTLVDSLASIVTSVRLAWQALGLTPPDAAVVRRVVGLKLDEAIRQLAPEESPERLTKLHNAYRDAFFSREVASGEEAPLYPGLAEAIDAMEEAGWLLGVATGKGRRGLLATLEAHGLRDRFVTLQTSDRAAGKPDPEMLFNAMAEAGAEPADTVMIGDTTFDILMARNARVAPLGVSWGYHDPEELLAAGARRIVDKAGELHGSAAALVEVQGP